MARSKHDALALDGTDAGGCTPMIACGAGTHLDKHRATVGVPHDQVDLAATAPGRPIIARQQPQSRLLQMTQGTVFGGIARLFAAGLTRKRPESGRMH